ncbi:MAG: glycosyltransferase family 4 protein [Desulfatibacillaceae bacterium]
MYIHYVYYHDPDFVPIHAAEVLCELARQGHDVHVFTSARQDVLENALPVPGITLHNLATLRMRFVAEPLLVARMLVTLAAACAKRRPDVFFTRHGATSMAPALVGRLLSVPCFVEVNDITLDKIGFMRTSAARRTWIKAYHYAVFHMAHRLLPVTEQIGEYYADCYGLPDARFICVPNGVNPERFSPRPQDEARRHWDIPEDAPVVLCLGSLFPWAGMETLIEAAPQVLEHHPGCLFLLGSGEEPYLSDVRARVAAAGLAAHFRFHGFIPWDRAAAYISMADVCAAPFIFKDLRSGISSLRVFAYLACERPVVGSDIPGLGDVLVRNECGLSHTMGNAPELAESLCTVLGDRERAREMGRAGRRFIIKQHGWPAIVRQLVSLFKESAS